MTLAIALKRCNQPENCAGRVLPQRTVGFRFLFGLAPDGGYLDASCHHETGALLPHLFTLTASCGLFLWPCSSLRFARRGSPLATVLPCGVRTFLTRRTGRDHPARISDRSLSRFIAPKVRLHAGELQPHETENQKNGADNTEPTRHARQVEVTRVLKRRSKHGRRVHPQENRARARPNRATIATTKAPTAECKSRRPTEESVVVYVREFHSAK